MIDLLENITGAKILNSLELGESIKKYIGYYNKERIVLRVYPKKDFYRNRFSREGAALRALNESLKMNNSHPSDFFIRFPIIINEWPKTEQGPIRALSYLIGDPFIPAKGALRPDIIDAFGNILRHAGKLMPKQFSFRNDFVALFNRPRSQLQAKNSKWLSFLHLVTKIIENSIDLDKVDELIHGDLHHMNLLTINSSKIQQPTFGIIDWEFATRGSINFDLAYLHVFSGWEPPETMRANINEWKGLAIATITYWYLINMPNSSKSNTWLNKLEQHVDTL